MPSIVTVKYVIVIPSFFSRAFSFKKKTPSGINKVEVPTKVISPDVLSNRNVNVPKYTLVTKSPLTFSNKPEKPQTNKIKAFYPVNSKGKSDTISQKDKCATSRQNPFAIAAKVTAAPTTFLSKSTSSSQSIPANLDASLEFPVDDWDDIDDFETPVKTKNDSFHSEKSSKCTNSVSSPSDEQTGFTGQLNPDPVTNLESSSDSAEKNVNEPCIEIDGPNHSANIAAVSPGPKLNPDPAECKHEDSPVRRTRRRPPAHLSKLRHFKSVLSDSEEDNDVEPLKETTGKTS